jgi:ABC-type polysaccharide/polyol phosphate export permease
VSGTRTFRRVFSDARQYRDLLVNLTQRELRSRYRRTVLGWVWSLLQPLMMTVVYAIVLGGFLKLKAAKGDPSGIDVFVLFLLSGVLPWNFFQASLTTAMGSVSNAGNLITRVWFPRELLPLASIIALYLSLLIELGVLSVAILAITQTLLLQYIPIVLVITLLELCFTAGVAFWLSACNVRYKDVEYITGILLLAYFYFTPIVYSSNLIPAKHIFGTSLTVRSVVLVNPMARFMMAYRNLMYDGRLPGINTMLWLVFWSGLSLFLGLRFFLRRADRFAEMM